MKRMNGFQFAASVMHSSAVDELMECMKEDSAKDVGKSAAARHHPEPLLPIWRGTDEKQSPAKKEDAYARAA